MQKHIATSLATLLAASQVAYPGAASAQSYGTTATPIKHVVVIFGENISFDHYFGTYPNALNPPGEPPFHAKPGTPSVNGFNDGLLYNNPNFLNKAGNGAGAVNPFRLDRSEAATNDQDHNYTPEQEAFHGGLMDSFPEYTGTPGPPPASQTTNGLVMGYYDGNTVTALWNYAQRFALNDNSFGTNFGPSTPGAINLISGQTGGVADYINGTGALVADGSGGYSDNGDADPIGDTCSTTTGETISMSGENIGDLLNAKGISWGWFEQGFNLSETNGNGTTGCNRSHTSTITKTKKADYIPHHEPFQYYKSTANPTHINPSSIPMVGQDGDPANHQYDTDAFVGSLQWGNFPAVSFLKAGGYQDAHAGYSDPLDEQTFVVHIINMIEQSKYWDSTAIFIAYDDSDGWYDHQMGPILNQSATAADALTGAGMCGTGDGALASFTALHAQGRCGYGPRLPFMVISPYSKQNYVDHSLTDQTSIIRFIEDNWLGGQRIGNGSFDVLAGPVTNMFDFSHPNFTPLILDEGTGEVVTTP